MDYAQQQRDPFRHMIGITLVVVFHIVLVYALVNGLARKVIDVIKQPLEVNLIEELKPLPPPPPPPPKVLPPVQKVVVPPPVYVPPPEVRVEAPPPRENVVVATTSAPPPPVEVAPEPPAPAPIAKAAPPAIVSVGVACPNSREVQGNTPYPSQAQRLGLSGEVVVEFMVNADGTISNTNIVKSPNRVFNSTVTDAVNKLHCVGQGQSAQVRWSFVFKQES
jgi:protein TonB